MTGRSWLRIVEWGIGLLVLAAIARYLVRDWDRLASRPWDVDWALLALASAFVVVAYSGFVLLWRRLVSRPSVLVAPLLLSQGLHASRDLPGLFGADAALCPLLGTEPALVELVLDKVREALHPAP